MSNLDTIEKSYSLIRSASSRICASFGYPKIQTDLLLLSSARRSCCSQRELGFLLPRRIASGPVIPVSLVLLVGWHFLRAPRFLSSSRQRFSSFVLINPSALVFYLGLPAVQCTPRTSGQFVERRLQHMLLTPHVLRLSQNSSDSLRSNCCLLSPFRPGPSPLLICRPECPKEPRQICVEEQVDINFINIIMGAARLTSCTALTSCSCRHRRPWVEEVVLQALLALLTTTRDVNNGTTKSNEDRPGVPGSSSHPARIDTLLWQP